MIICTPAGDRLQDYLLDSISAADTSMKNDVSTWICREEFWYGMLEHGKNVYRTPAINKKMDAHFALEAAKALEQDDHLAQTIAKGAQDLAVKMLTTHNIELFMLALLRQYADMMQFKVALHQDAIPIEQSLMGQSYMRPHDRTCPLCHM